MRDDEVRREATVREEPDAGAVVQGAETTGEAPAPNAAHAGSGVEVATGGRDPGAAGADAAPVAGVDGPPAAAGAATTVPLDAVRALVLRAYPEAPPELVQGDSLAALVASAERAVELRQRLLAEAQSAVPPVAAGAPRRGSEPDAGRLSPFEKIARAIAGRGN